MAQIQPKCNATAEASEDGSHYILNGTKLWCSNGLKAGVIIVTARTPDLVVNGKARKQITAFILEMNAQGVELKQRCHFMGLRALYNGVVFFDNVRLPSECIIAAPGKGLKVALTTLNAGRLSIPASCLGISKVCLQQASEWARTRVQWGAPIIEHAAVANMVRRMASHTFALQAMIRYTANIVDRNPNADIRIEAAMCKMWGTEKAWDTINLAVQIRGGRGYETVDSLAERGEAPMPFERFLRDARVNTIFEGSSEIMRLFIMREALDTHLTKAGAAANSQLEAKARLQTLIKALPFYLTWYPKQYLATFTSTPPNCHPRVKKHMRYVRKTSKKLARTLFHKMVIIGPSLEKKQVLLARFCDIGTDLFMISASCSYCHHKLESGDDEVLAIFDDAVLLAKQRIKHAFNGIKQNPDTHGQLIADAVQQNDLAWLEHPR